MTNWWSYFKEKSESIVSMYKEDLQEFTSTITNDTKSAFEQAKNVSSFLGLSNKPNKSLVADRYKAKILALQNEPNTYLVSPADEHDFSTWKSTWKLQDQTDEISQTLASNSTMEELHTKLVPLSISYATFWERYFYKLHKLNQEEDRRAELIARATKTDEEIVSWEDADDSTPKEEIVVKPEELEDYLNQLDESTETKLEPVESVQKSSTKSESVEKENTPVQVKKSTAEGSPSNINTTQQSDPPKQIENQQTVAKPISLKNIEEIDSGIDGWD